MYAWQKAAVMSLMRNLRIVEYANSKTITGISKIVKDPLTGAGMEPMKILERMHYSNPHDQSGFIDRDQSGTYFKPFFFGPANDVISVMFRDVPHNNVIRAANTWSTWLCR